MFSKKVTALLIFLMIAILFAGCQSVQDPKSQDDEIVSPKPVKTIDTEVEVEIEPDPDESKDVLMPNEPQAIHRILDENGTTIQTRFTPPEGFERAARPEDSFGTYLRGFTLKAHGSKVYLYNGQEKSREVHEAVLDIDVGVRDLQQCADAAMRLRAEYLYGLEKYDQIHFNFTNGFKASYSKWRQGYRIAVEGNNAVWVRRGSQSVAYEDFRKYLDIVFAYAGTLSLSQELYTRSLTDMEIGDVFIQGGSPGHCVMVVDMAMHPDTGEKVFMLAQSYMPAQDIHVLKNPRDADISPWYTLSGENGLGTPEWSFDWSDLKAWDQE